MSTRPLSIVGLGMVSCLGEGSEINASAMRCDYDGFELTSFMQPNSNEMQVGAQIKTKLRGIPKLSYMNEIAVKEAVKDLPEDFKELPIIFCMPEKNQDSFFSDEISLQKIMDSTFKKLNISLSRKYSSAYWQHRCSYVSALKKAQELIYSQGQEFILIVSIDSLLNANTLLRYGGNLYGEGRRLLGDNFSDGFIPGEASTAILVSKIKNSSSNVIISGIGEGQETATVNNDEVLKGQGISIAIKNASKESGVRIHETGFRVSSVSGENYFFSEASLAQMKTLEKKVDNHPLWHPADCIGEVGAAVGGAMTIMTYYAFLKNYAPGKNAICHISNDNSQRGAFVMQYKPVNQILVMDLKQFL